MMTDSETRQVISLLYRPPRRLVLGVYRLTQQDLPQRHCVKRFPLNIIPKIRTYPQRRRRSPIPIVLCVFRVTKLGRKISYPETR